MPNNTNGGARSQRNRRRFKGFVFHKFTKVCCQYCDIELTEKTATIDHWTPLVRGGSDAYENYRIACFKCNVEFAHDWKTFNPGCLMSFDEINALKKIGLDKLKFITKRK